MNVCRLIVRYGGEQQNYLDEVKKNGVGINKDRIGIECELKGIASLLDNQ
ncbi:MAG: hypothetical protein PUI68_02480 [Mollicutes bacterium]|nr:hypothetical protein [Mollicutes bacterium]